MSEQTTFLPRYEPAPKKSPHGIPPFVLADARFDPTRRFRYRLDRAWDLRAPRAVFVMLNPSTADESELDPTLRRCAGFAHAWGFGGFTIGNLFALRSTDPRGLRRHWEWHRESPVGPVNDLELDAMVASAGIVVCGWGTHGQFLDRADAVVKRLRGLVDLHALALTKNGDPGHPLYLAKDRKPFVWIRRSTCAE
jgi:hypothetical protein